MGRVLLKVTPSRFLHNPLRPPQLTRHPHPFRLLFWATVGQFTPLRLLLLPERLMPQNQSRKDLTHEPICEQEI